VYNTVNLQPAEPLVCITRYHWGQMKKGGEHFLYKIHMMKRKC